MTLRLADDRDKPSAPAHAWSHTVHHGGRTFVATATMATIFEAHARDVIERGETELVPLLHQGGVDLLLISPTAVFTVVKIELGITGTARRRRPLTPAS